MALSHPRLTHPLGSKQATVKIDVPRSGIALYFLVDESGSMSEKVTTYGPQGARQQVPKIDLAKRAILEFLGRRSDDVAGLIAFARVPEVLCPLTLNRQELAAKLNAIEPVKEDERNGTAIGYAIFKAVNIIVATKYYANRQEDAHKSVYDITNQAIIIVTDGLQSPNPADKDNPFRFMPPDEAIKYAKDNGVRVFYIGIDPILASSDYKDDISKMRKSMQGSGGELFIATTELPVERIMSQINSMEKSELPPQTVLQPVREYPLAHVFILLAMLSLAFGVLLETQIVRKVP